MKIVNPFAALMRRLDEAGTPAIQCTLDPVETPAIRLHLVSPRPGLFRGESMLQINSQHMLPLHHGLAALLRTFLGELKSSVVPNREVSDDQMAAILGRTADRMHKLYPGVPKEHFIRDLGRLQELIKKIAYGEPVSGLERYAMPLTAYAKHMRGPLRMDLAVMPMTIDSVWSCPLACTTICYAAKGEAMKVTKDEMLTTVQWKQVLDILWQAGTTQVSFTGGDPLARPDIVELVAHAAEFTTRLNTGAVLLTPELARRLHEADLDVMQITVYSSNASIHDRLVGRPGSLKKTLEGIRMAMDAGIEVSINTPLVVENVAGYTETIRFLNEFFGVRYFTCSGMLPAGGAVKRIESGGAVDQDELFRRITAAKQLADSLNCELDFTSPGVLTEKQIATLQMNMPACGACLGNMAVAPDGEVLPCQSWVANKKALGNILRVPWKKIWDGPACKAIRKASGLKNACPLAEV